MQSGFPPVLCAIQGGRCPLALLFCALRLVHLHSHVSSLSCVICLAVINPWTSSYLQRQPNKLALILVPRGHGRAFKPPAGNSDQQPQQQTTGGLSSVMLEIRGAEVDPEKRLKVIEASQKNRERELADRADEFEEELKGFVGGKKLKMTNGAEEEAERARQAKND